MFSVFTDRDWPALWVICGLAFILILDFFYRGGQIWNDRSFTPLILFVGAYIVATFAMSVADPITSILGRTPQDRALTITTRVIYAAIVYVVFVSVLSQGDDLFYRRVFAIQMTVGAAIALFGIIQYISYNFLSSDLLIEIEPTNETYKLASSFATSGGERVYRASAVYSEPSSFGFFLVPLLTKAVVARIEHTNVFSKSGQMVFIGIFALAIVLNLSLTAVLAATTIMSILLLLSLRHSKHFTKVLAGMVIVIIAIVISPLGSLILERVARVLSLQDGSTLDRLYRQYVGIKVFMENPFTGIGPGGFAFEYARSGGLMDKGFAAPLSMWLSFLTDVGIVGAAPFFVFLVHVVRRGMTCRNRHPLVRVYLWGLGGLLLLQTTNDYWYGEVFWFELAMIVSLASAPALRTLQRP